METKVMLSLGKDNIKSISGQKLIWSRTHHIHTHYNPPYNIKGTLFHTSAQNTDNGPKSWG